MKKEYDFIINPKARSGMGEMIWNALEPELKKRRVAYRAHRTEKRRHAEKIASEITGDGGEHTIVVLGGDGTVNEVVNGLRDPEKVLLGYIPIGSSNDFARGLGITRDPGRGLEAVLCPKEILRMDLGEICAGDDPDPEGDSDRGERDGTGRGSGRKRRVRRFAVSAGIGFDAAVCHEVCVSRWKEFLNRLGLGKLSYAAVALDRLKKDRPVRITVTLPGGERKVFERAYFAAFMNLRFEGGGFRFCPEARPDDGLLDVIVLHHVSPFQILLLLPTAFAGRHTAFRSRVNILRCSECSVETTRPLPLHTDGEPGFPRDRVSVRIMGEKLRVITG